MKIIGEGNKIVNKLNRLKSTTIDEDWKITYVTPIHGGWDFIVECNFGKLEELETIMEFIRSDKELSRIIETTTTLISVKKNYP